MSEGNNDFTRREFVGVAAAGVAMAGAVAEAEPVTAAVTPQQYSLTINGEQHQLDLEARVTLLDLLRERLHLTGTKKGCDHGQCGACTVLSDGVRIVSCLTLAVTQQGRNITTIEGLGSGEELHPMQQAFLDFDGFQCGFCTAGQICSAVGLLKEAGAHELSEPEIRERMSGNICRCGAYPNIVAAVAYVQKHSGAHGSRT